jgi:hypothetical protein
MCIMHIEGKNLTKAMTTINNSPRILWDKPNSLILHPEEFMSDVIDRLTDKSGNDVRLKYNSIYILVKVKMRIQMISAKAKKCLSQSHLAKKNHGLELGFAITFHKIKGQRCDKLIVN